MARALDLDKLPATANRGNLVYEWNEWLDGRVWELKRGVDFAVKTRTFAGTAGDYGRTKGLRVATRVIDDDTVLIQMLGPYDGPGQVGQQTRRKR